MEIAVNNPHQFLAKSYQAISCALLLKILLEDEELHQTEMTLMGVKQRNIHVASLPS